MVNLLAVVINGRYGKNDNWNWLMLQLGTGMHQPTPLSTNEVRFRLLIIELLRL